MRADPAAEQAGDFESWYEATRPSLVRSLVALYGDWSVADEVADEALARAYASWSRVRRMSSPAGWTYRVAINVARRSYSRQVRERSLLYRTSLEADDAHLELESLIEAHDLIQQLPPRMRQAVVLRYIGDLSERDVGKSMNISEGAASALLAKARRKLRGEDRT